ncbi:MAG: S9 family peptidase, partial [Psychroserpens sp.]|nr:S9 family peptidase [Psychroserpens sp.]
MRNQKIVLLSLICLSLYNCKEKASNETKRNMSYLSVEQPQAKQKADTLNEHDNTRMDKYFWMRLSDAQKNAETPDAQTQDVIDYLNAENAYTEAVMSHTDLLQETLYNEIVGRIKKDDESLPYDYNGYTYYSRYKEGAEYALFCRKKIGSDKEEIYINGPELAEGLSYFGLGGSSISPNNERLAYAVDTISRRQYTVYFKDLRSKELLDDKLDNTNGGIVWANDNQTVFYIKKDPQTLRNNRIYKHVIGTPQSNDELVYEEKDAMFNCYMYKSKSEDYIFIISSQTVSTEVRYLNANTPNAEWQVIQPRARNLEYSVDHYGDHFYIRTNADDAFNFKLVKTPTDKTSRDNWEDVISHRENVFFQGSELFSEYLVLSERKDGLRTIRVKTWDGKEDKYIDFNDPSYAAYVSTNMDFDTDVLRYYYTSLTTPGSTYEYNMITGEQKLL